MKKRMLITTIVMVLVVAIALTTSSLAWFTMSAQVSISEVSFGAVSYKGADLSVAGLARTNFSTSASLGTSGSPFEPVQGNPYAHYTEGTADGTILFAADNHGTGAYTFDDLTWYKASDVTTTPVGSETANQQVKLADATAAGPYFLGGFNIRNNGTDATAIANVDVNAVLNVGKANLVNPNGSAEAQTGSPDGDEYYFYGNPNSTATASWIANDLFPYNETMEQNGYFRNTTSGNYPNSDSDRALAGGLRVAIFSRTWTYDSTSEDDYKYTNEEAQNEGIIAFSNYQVGWNDDDGEWDVVEAPGQSNALYVKTVAAGVYSKNPNLAVGEGTTPSATHHVNAANAPAVDEYDITATPGNGNVLPGISKNINPRSGDNDEIYNGIEFVIVVWLDGWDDESLPVAGGGRVSLSYTVTSD